MTGSSGVAVVGVDVPADRIDRRIYVDPDVFALEQDRVFRRTWQYVCHAGEIPHAGDYINVTLAGERVAVWRDKDGRLQGFHNACSHRGAEIAPDDRGTCSGFFHCLYHGWTYDLQGALVAAPYPQAYGDGFDRRANGLRPVSVESFAGMVFAAIDPVVTSLTDYLGEAAEHLERFCAGTEVIGRVKWTYAGNWKLWHDNFTDNYHPEFVHYFVRDFQAGYADAGSSHALDSGHGLIRWPAMPPNFDRYIAGLREESGWEVDPFQNEEWAPPPMDVDFETDDAVLTVFPNLDLQWFVGGSTIVIEVLTPRSVDETVIELVCLGVQGEPEPARRYRLDRAAGWQGSWGKVSADDMEAMVRTQRGCRAAGGPLSNMGRGSATGTVGECRDDQPLRSFHAGWRRYMNGAGSHGGER